METTVIDYSIILNSINDRLTDISDMILAIRNISEQTNYLIMFLFGAILATSVIGILKGLK